MPRNMSFALTTRQFENKTKTVTRRSGWAFLKPGDVVMGCKKCMGLKPGERVEKLGLIRIMNVRREKLSDITDDDVSKEGFPEMDANEFIRFFILMNGGELDQLLNRIEFEYI